MRDVKAVWSDQRVETVVATLLLYGVIVSFAIVLAGGIAFLIQSGGGHPDYHIFRPTPSSLRTVAGIVRAAAALDSRGIIQLGILLLIATPIARVAFSVYAFARQRDYTYVLVTLLVLSALLFSLVRGTD
jgi:uncharacterized membrane protein